MSRFPHEDVTFTNGQGEPFHLSVFQPKGSHANAEEAPPVLLCVHGAGMSGDNFYRLAAYLQREGKDFPVTSSIDLAAQQGQPPSSQQHHTTPSPSQGLAVAPGWPSLAPKPKLPPPASSPAHVSAHPVTAHALPRPGMPPPQTATSAAMSGVSGDSSVLPLQPDPSADEVALAVVTFDLRCHGESTFAGGEDHLTLEVLTQDFREVLTHVKTTLFPRSDIYVLGHSLGGSIVAQGLSLKEMQSRIAGVILVDVVEGTAKMSLEYMHDFLKRRPDSFDTVRDAETWFLHHGGMRTPEGAAVSVPPLLKKDASTGKYTWKTNLSGMEAVWDGWFDGLDKAFVGLPFPKMLCLANAERLDTELTVAQMQGKFQFEIVGNNCGHYVMDDATATLGSKVMRLVKRIETLTRKMKGGIKPGMALHLNNTTVPPSRLGV